jgi:hypothetical protein
VEKVKELSQAANYGGALMPGEGAAIAQFVQKNMRIPRRGEVGTPSIQLSCQKWCTSHGFELCFYFSASGESRMDWYGN